MFKRIIGRFINSNEYKISTLQPLVDKINSLEEKYSKYSDSDLKSLIKDWKDELRQPDLSIDEINQRLDDLMPDVYAIVREASKRVMGQRHRDVQIISGIVLHQNKISEQKTGEGKTLTATLPLILNSLPGLGTHLITPNDYLSKHGAGWYGPVYDFLGISVGVILDRESYVYDSAYTVDKVIDEYTKHLKPVQRRYAYSADITYGTASSFGFDYLRDNMSRSQNDIVQLNSLGNFGKHRYAIVDEVDSILIDIARTPLIISAPTEVKSDIYYKFAELADTLIQGTDYDVDEKDRLVTITEIGINKIERRLGVENLYEKDFDTIHRIENALSAKEFYLKNRDYIVKDKNILIVDQNTGRVLYGNRWSKGLHQAIEAKENVEINAENKTVATISYQNYFRLYDKLAGMTGTAETEAEEFFRIYGLDVVVIPTFKQVRRIDHTDVVYKTETGKYKAIAKDISERHANGQPILIGTISIEKSELLSKFLKRLNIPHEILNAKQHEREALIIRQAGKKGAVTVATNMAGRGVDIILGGDPFDKEVYEEIIDIGGLYVIGTERHDSRRIDNQLRGRSGRQGDVGESRFYLSLQDDLMRIFGGSAIENIMNRLGVGDDMPIEAGMISRSIENAQKKVEGINFDRRRALVEYDDVVNVQREAMYSVRRKILFAEFNDLESFYEWLNSRITVYFPDFQEVNNKRLKEYPAEVWFEVTKRICIEVIDLLWMDHIATMDDLGNDVRLKTYGSGNPIVEYKREGKILFDTMMTQIWSNIGERLSNVKVEIKKAVQDTTNQKLAYISPDVESGFSDESSHLNEVRNNADSKISPQATVAKVGRNDPCPCGSGKKYKHCHGKTSSN